MHVPAFVPVALVLFVVVALLIWVLAAFLRDGLRLGPDARSR